MSTHLKKTLQRIPGGNGSVRKELQRASLHRIGQGYQESGMPCRSLQFRDTSTGGPREARARRIADLKPKSPTPRVVKKTKNKHNNDSHSLASSSHADIFCFVWDVVLS